MLVFFPFAFSGTCDKEMCTFRDDSGMLQVLGAQLIGISVEAATLSKLSRRRTTCNSCS